MLQTIVCLGGLCCYSVLNALLMFKFRLFHTWTPPDNQKWYTSSLWALGWIKRQQNGQNRATVSIYLALRTPNLYVNGAILNDRIPNHCKITPHSWHSRLVTEDKVALYLNQTILICKHSLYTHLHFHSAWIFACAKFCLASIFKSLSDIIALHIMQTTAPQKKTCDSSQNEKPASVGLFTLIARRLGVIFHAFSVLVVLADKAGSFMVDLKEMRATNLLCLVAT